MSKMSELSMVIEDLRKCANTLNETANWLTEMFNGDEPDAKEASANSPEPVLTLEAVRAVLADMSRKGYTAQIRSLLQTYGASKLSEIDPANYKALLEDVEGLDDVT